MDCSDFETKNTVKKQEHVSNTKEECMQQPTGKFWDKSSSDSCSSSDFSFSSDSQIDLEAIPWHSNNVSSFAPESDHTMFIGNSKLSITTGATEVSYTSHETLGNKKTKPLSPRMESSNLQHDDLKYIELLGAGCFGNVMKARNAGSNKDFAVKLIVSKKNPSNGDDMREVLIMYKLSKKGGHPNIVGYHSHWHQDSFTLPDIAFNCISNPQAFKDVPILAIKMDFCDGGTLEDTLAKNKPKETRKSWFLDILTGVNFMHQEDIMHRDLKPRNIFLSNNTAKVGDFGKAKKKNSKDCGDVIACHTPDIVRNNYRAPELDTRNYDYRVDIYSVGCILFVLLNPCTSEKERNILLRKICDGDLPDTFTPDYGKKDQDFIRKMTARDPGKRVNSISEIIKDAYIIG